MIFTEAQLATPQLRVFLLLGRAGEPVLAVYYFRCQFTFTVPGSFTL